MLFRLGGTWRIQLASLPIIGAGLDWGENVVQILALVEGPDLLGAKLLLTGSKFAFAMASIALIIVLALIAFFQRLKRPA